MPSLTRLLLDEPGTLQWGDPRELAALRALQRTWTPRELTIGKPCGQHAWFEALPPLTDD